MMNNVIAKALEAHEALLEIQEGIVDETQVSVPDLNDAIENVKALIINTLLMQRRSRCA